MSGGVLRWMATTSVRFTCPRGHVVAVVHRMAEDGMPFPEAGRQQHDGEPTNLWSDGTSHVLEQLAGCDVVADDERSTPIRISVRCPRCARQRSAAARWHGQRRWEGLLSLLDAHDGQDTRMVLPA